MRVPSGIQPVRSCATGEVVAYAVDEPPEHDGEPTRMFIIWNPEEAR